MIQQDISIKLKQIIQESPYNQIDYDYLLVHNPPQIRIEEQKIAETEASIQLPDGLIVQNIDIPSSDTYRTIRLRTYQPEGESNKPVLLYFHGGAFIYRTPEQYDFIFFELAKVLHVLVISVDYRLAPEHPFPAALNDGYDALLWLNQHADQFGGNTNNISIGGSSAGGTIAASLAHLARDKKEVAIKHQYLVYPPMDHRLTTPSMQSLAHAPMQTQQASAYMWKYYLGATIDQPLPYAVPSLQNDFSNLPATTIIVCEFDPLQDEAKEYAKKLKQEGISTTVFEIKRATHVFDFFPTTQAKKFWQQQIAYLKTILIR